MSKFIEIRRHAARAKPGQHLSQQGIAMARMIGGGLGPFDRVVTSPLPRAIETAVAMGFAVDEEEEALASYGEDVEMVLPWPQPFAAYQAARHHPAVQRATRRLSALYTALANYLAEGRAALVISHGGIVELSAVACVPEADYGSFGPFVDCCEGVRLTWEQDAFTGVEVFRIPT